MSAEQDGDSHSDENGRATVGEGSENEEIQNVGATQREMNKALKVIASKTLHFKLASRVSRLLETGDIMTQWGLRRRI